MKYPRTVEGFLVKHTGAKGYGLYATRDYKKGAVLTVVQGIRISDADRRLTHRAVQIGPRSFIEPKRFSAIWYLNHSCNPTAYMDMKTLVARRDIKAGEEITADYSLFTNYPTWDMDCECAHGRCRKLIVPYQRLAKKPGRFVSSYLREV